MAENKTSSSQLTPTSGGITNTSSIHAELPEDVIAECDRTSKGAASKLRGVKRLNAEQLARKRATDREAQRSLRQRTKYYIQCLEIRIRQLSSREGMDEAMVIEAATQRNIELNEELRQLRAILENLNIRRTEPRSSRRWSCNSSSSVANDSSPMFDSRNPSNNKHARSIVETPDQLMDILRYKARRPVLRQPSWEHVWEISLPIVEPTSPIDSILYGMVQHQRSLCHTKGITGQELAGPRIPNLTALVTPGTSVQVDTVTQVISDLLSRITYRSFIDTLGAFMVMYPIYQWLIMRSYETYRNIPSWLAPVPLQRTTPHPIWISALGTPKLREVVLANQEKYATEEFQYLFVASINVNWTRGVEAALTRRADYVTISQEFWDHTASMENWSMDEPFQLRYPELRDFCKFTEYPGNDPNRGGN